MLKRTYPEIEDGSQMSPIFIPETFLPTVAGCVDFDSLQEKLATENYNKSNINTQNNGLGQKKGDYTERCFYDELRRVLNDPKVVVLHSPRLFTPTTANSNSNQCQEADFIIVNQNRKYIMCIETKYNLFSKCEGNVQKSSIQKGIEQLNTTKQLLETYFFNDIDVNQWKFIGVLGYLEIEENVNCCHKCKDFVIKPQELSKLLSKFPIESDNEILKDDYKFIIKNILFTVFASPGPKIRCFIDEETSEKIIGSVGDSKGKRKKQKIAQGDHQNILFWTPEQFDLMKLDDNCCPMHRFVLFASSMSTGKTEVIRGLIKRLLENNQKCHMVVSTYKLGRKTLLHLKMEMEFDTFENQFKISTLDFDDINDKISLANLKMLMKQYPEHHTFVDEFVFNNLDNDVKVEIQTIVEQRKKISLCFWLVVAGIQNEKNLSEENLKTFFRDFTIVNMKLPLR